MLCSCHSSWALSCSLLSKCVTECVGQKLSWDWSGPLWASVPLAWQIGQVAYVPLPASLGSSCRWIFLGHHVHRRAVPLERSDSAFGRVRAVCTYLRINHCHLPFDTSSLLRESLRAFSDTDKAEHQARSAFIGSSCLSSCLSHLTGFHYENAFCPSIPAENAAYL